MTKIDRKAYYDYKEMQGLKDEGLDMFTIANLMDKDLDYLYSLERYFDWFKLRGLSSFLFL